ncbi:MAG TPA: nuclear transport factor 2 family protein [Allosphingosinicella sp.]|nr:nuclear transport factor 2 family protein [Allosphingosinicella sp.]
MASDRDWQEIRGLQLAYGRTFDAREAEAFAALYTEDAVLVQIGGKEIRTREKFAKAVRNMPPAGRGRHEALETALEIDGDAARGTCRFAAETSAGASVTGHYEDEYRRTGAGWRFSRRAVFLDPQGAGA